MVDLSTPGRLDVDIVKNTLKEGVDVELGRFLRLLLFEAGEAVRSSFQEFLQRQRLSSHIRIIARRVGR